MSPVKRLHVNIAKLKYSMRKVHYGYFRCRFRRKQFELCEFTFGNGRFLGWFNYADTGWNMTVLIGSLFCPSRSSRVRVYHKIKLPSHRKTVWRSSRLFCLNLRCIGYTSNNYRKYIKHSIQAARKWILVSPATFNVDPRSETCYSTECHFVTPFYCDFLYFPLQQQKTRTAVYFQLYCADIHQILQHCVQIKRLPSISWRTFAFCRLAFFCK